VEDRVALMILESRIVLPDALEVVDQFTFVIGLSSSFRVVIFVAAREVPAAKHALDALIHVSSCQVIVNLLQ